MTDAQPSTDPVVLDVVSVDDGAGLQNVPSSAIPAISNSGDIVVYEAISGVAGASSDDRRVWIRDRVGNTSRPVAELASAAPGISGNGCVVAYSAIGETDVALTVVDRCAAPNTLPLPIGGVLDTVSRVDDVAGIPMLAVPALSFDGSTIVWSTGREIRRYARPASGEPYGPPLTLDVAAGGLADVVTGTRVDVSADGRNIVFLAGIGSAPFSPDQANVYVWTAVPPPGVAEPELLSAAASGDPTTGESAWPTISDDGLFVTFESTAVDLAVVASAPVVAPFVVGVDRTARTQILLLEDATHPSLSADGNHVAYQRGDALRVLSSTGGSTADAGTDELSSAGPSGPAAISQFGRWLVFTGSSDLSTDAIDPGPAGSVPVIWAADLSSSTDGVVDTTTSTTATTTLPPTVTTVPTTTTKPTVPTSSEVTIPATTLLPNVIFPRFPTVSSFPSVSYPSASYPRQPSQPWTPTYYNWRGDTSTVDDLVSASASAVVFEPTVVDAGRRTQPVTVTNPTGDALQISSASIDRPDTFAIVSDGCTGVPVAPGGSCVVEVQFAPIAVGQTVGSVVFRLSDGSTVTASLVGDGVAEPTLDLVPAVAGAGQTVTVFGAGFPPGVTVELWQPGTAAAAPIVVESDGTFAHVVVVLPNTVAGPAVLEVSGQLDAFDDVSGELLVSSRGSTSGNTAVRGGPNRPLGR